MMSIETTVHKMTGFPAERLRLRGRVAEGLIADLDVFDPDTVIVRATLDGPHQLEAGVTYVLVEGEHMVQRGNHTGTEARTGQGQHQAP